MIDRDQAAEIRRYFFAEHWKKGPSHRSSACTRTW